MNAAEEPSCVTRTCSTPVAAYVSDDLISSRTHPAVAAAAHTAAIAKEEDDRWKIYFLEIQNISIAYKVGFIC